MFSHVLTCSHMFSYAPNWSKLSNLQQLPAEVSTSSQHSSFSSPACYPICPTVQLSCENVFGLGGTVAWVVQFPGHTCHYKPNSSARLMPKIERREWYEAGYVTICHVCMQRVALFSSCRGNALWSPTLCKHPAALAIAPGGTPSALRQETNWDKGSVRWNKIWGQRHFFPERLVASAEATKCLHINIYTHNIYCFL